MLRHYTTLIAVLYALFVTVLLVMAVTPSLVAVAVGMLVVVWATGPGALAWALAGRYAEPWAVTVMAIAQTAVCGLGAYAYHYTFFVAPDAQGALLFLFLPFWQYLAVAGVAVLIALARALLKHVR